MTTLRPGDVVLVPFPFSDLSGVKKRPALVLAVVRSQEELVCLMLISVFRASPLEYPIKAWAEAGLLKPTAAKLHRIFTIDSTMVLKRLGAVNTQDFQAILDSVNALLARGET